MAGEEEEVEELEVITLTDEDGEDHDFALLAVVPVEGNEYAILAPVDQLEAQAPELDLLAFLYKEVGDDDVELEPVDDPALLERVFAAAEEEIFGDEFDEDEGDAPTDDA